MADVGKGLIVLGIVLIVAGVLMATGAKVPFLGKLPGDFVVERKNFSLYFPLTTCILISIILFLFMRFLGK